MYHDNKHAGLQSHSIGELYPYSIVVLEHNGKSYCQARNLVSGWRGQFIRFTNWQSSFDRAHLLAEREAHRRIADDRKRQAHRAFWRNVLCDCPNWAQTTVTIVLVAVASILSAKLSEDHASKATVAPIVFELGEQ